MTWNCLVLPQALSLSTVVPISVKITQSCVTESRTLGPVCPYPSCRQWSSGSNMPLPHFMDLEDVMCGVCFCLARYSEASKMYLTLTVKTKQDQGGKCPKESLAGLGNGEANGGAIRKDQWRVLKRGCHRSHPPSQRWEALPLKHIRPPSLRSG